MIFQGWPRKPAIFGWCFWVLANPRNVKYQYPKYHNVNKAYASRKLCGYEVTSIPNLVLFELEAPVHVNSKCFLKQ